eukprot:gb/GEZJ01002644.1/.p1 GENE.gb/GEZJ01002644.1/~~gb/GEZJ01002644.1/.p1  ORF type:complete len:148 (-),score=11.81 gb/GEZJ01002644.1/:182-625(-)
MKPSQHKSGFLLNLTPLQSHCQASHRSWLAMVDSRRDSTSDKALIAVSNVCFRWKSGRSALKNVSLTVREGELTMVLGHNGSGKSTLLQLLRGVLNPSTGSIHLEQPCAYVQQDPNIQIVMPTIGMDIASSVRKDSTRIDPSRRLLA